jgi:hypothetical protein
METAIDRGREAEARGKGSKWKLAARLERGRRRRLQRSLTCGGGAAR